MESLKTINSYFFLRSQKAMYLILNEDSLRNGTDVPWDRIQRLAGHVASRLYDLSESYNAFLCGVDLLK